MACHILYVANEVFFNVPDGRLNGVLIDLGVSPNLFI